MRIDNGRYREVVMDWGNITPPLKAGTPIAADGTVSNDGDAIGIVPVAVAAQTVMPRSIFILDAGDVDLEEVEAESGLTIAAEAKEAMSAIHWHHADGTVDDYATGGGSGGSGGGVFYITETHDSSNDTYTLSATYNDIKAAIEAGKLPVIIRTYSSGEAGEEEIALGYISSTERTSSGCEVCSDPTFGMSYVSSDPDEPLVAYTD